MQHEGILIKYMFSLIERYDASPALNIPGASKGAQFVKLHDVYTKLSVKDITISNTSDTPVRPGNPFRALMSQRVPYTEEERYAAKKSGEAKAVTEIYISSIGGGKTTFLKMNVVLYAYLYLKSHDYDLHSKEFAEATTSVNSLSNKAKDFNETVSHCITTLDEINDNVNDSLSQNAFPIFIDAEAFIGISIKRNFEEIIINEILQCLSEYEDIISYEQISATYNEQSHIVLIIDGIDVLAENDDFIAFFEELQKYVKQKNGNVDRVILSSRKKKNGDYLFDSLDETSKGPWYQCGYKYEIEPFDTRQPDVIKLFIKKWYMALMPSADSSEESISFFKSVLRNSEMQWQISSPLNLLGIIMICLDSRFIPSDLPTLYSRNIQVLLNWANQGRQHKYNLREVLKLFAFIIYKATQINPGKSEISVFLLKNVLKEADIAVTGIVDDKQVEPVSIDEFISFLCESNLLSFNSSSNSYLISSQYQAYFIAYCITNNLLPRKDRKRNRYDYLRAHIKNEEPFWDSVAVLVAAMDENLCEDIIDDLFSLIHGHIKNGRDYGGMAYAVSILLKIIGVPGIYLDNENLQFLTECLVYFNWPTLGKDIKHIINTFSNDDIEPVNFVLDYIIRGYMAGSQHTDADYKGTFRDAVFSILWNFDVSQSYMTDAMELFLDDNVSVGILNEIYYTEPRSKILKNPLSFEIQCASGRQYWLLRGLIRVYSKSSSSPIDEALRFCISYPYDALGIFDFVAKNARDLSQFEHFGFTYESLTKNATEIGKFLLDGAYERPHTHWFMSTFYLKTYMNFYRNSICLDPSSPNGCCPPSEFFKNHQLYDVCKKRIIKIWNEYIISDWGFRTGREIGDEVMYVAACPFSFSYDFKDQFNDDEKSQFISYLEEMLHYSVKKAFRRRLIYTKMLALMNYNGSSLDNSFYERMREIKTDIAQDQGGSQFTYITSYYKSVLGNEENSI